MISVDGLLMVLLLRAHAGPPSPENHNGLGWTLRRCGGTCFGLGAKPDSNETISSLNCGKQTPDPNNVSVPFEKLVKVSGTEGLPIADAESFGVAVIPVVRCCCRRGHCGRRRRRGRGRDRRCCRRRRCQNLRRNRRGKVQQVPQQDPTRKTYHAGLVPNGKLLHSC